MFIVFTYLVMPHLYIQEEFWDRKYVLQWQHTQLNDGKFPSYKNMEPHYVPINEYRANQMTPYLFKAIR